MGVGGEGRELDAPARISVTETFDVPWYPGSAEITHELEETDGVTTSKITLRYESSDARDTVFASPMREGLAAGCVRLDALLASESA